MKTVTLFVSVTLITITTKSVLAQGHVSSTHVQQDSNCYCLEEVVSDLYSPTTAIVLSSDHGDMARLLVVEQRGLVKYVKGGQSSVFMDIRDRVHVTNEMGDSRGLLSLALSPGYDKDGDVFVYYIRLVDRQQFAYVSSFKAANNKVDPSSERFLLRIFQPYKHGNGGPMFFGDDGFLYIVVGDGGATDDKKNFAQNKNSFHGSILRLDPKGTQQFTAGESGVAKMYSCPGDNPFVNETSAKEEIFAFGFRNPWGCSVDSSKVNGDGGIYCVDTGTNQFDEVNVIESGKNYGWPLKEGGTCLKPPSCENIENEGVPLFEFQHYVQHALVGGYVYRGKDIEWMKDRALYTFADILSGATYYLQVNESTKNLQAYEWPLCEAKMCPPDARGRPLRHLFGFSQDSRGELYFTMVNSMKAFEQDGKIYKVRGTNGPSSGYQSRKRIENVVIVFLSGMIVAIVTLSTPTS